MAPAHRRGVWWVWLFTGFALLSLGINLWQFLAGMHFPLHRCPARDAGFTPGISVLKPLKGADLHTAGCLESWLVQEYDGPVEVLFAITDPSDAARSVVEELLARHPAATARLHVLPDLLGASAKVSKLAHLEELATHDVLVVSDADVRVPPDFLGNLIQPLRNPRVGLVNCFYRLATPATAAMRWEAVATNADFWSQVLQSRALGPQDFALGAVMAMPRSRLEDIGGFSAFVDHLADDFQIGNRIARRGGRIELSPVVVDCHDAPAGWADVWAHQLRWNRTIRVCRPLPYAASLLTNLSLWAVLAGVAWHIGAGRPLVWAGAAAIFGLRCVWARRLERRLRNDAGPATFRFLDPLLKDALSAAVWAGALFGSRVVWRGTNFRVHRDGRLERLP
jgi:ceramide glucosyltransferase